MSTTTTTITAPTTPTSLIVASTKATVGEHLCRVIAPIALQAVQQRGRFSLALSGGSLPGFLAALPQAFSDHQDARFDTWHIVLADERCVPSDHADSNLGALKTTLLSQIPQIPAGQIYGIDETLLSQDSAHAIAVDYNARLVQALGGGGGGNTPVVVFLDLAVLGFGPDGHTCSLFPNHALVTAPPPPPPSLTTLVAAIEDSPKPPPNRITLTLSMLNSHTRHVIFCGAGASKSPILRAVFDKVIPKRDESTTSSTTAQSYHVQMAQPTTALPCGMVAPNTTNSDDDDHQNTVTWVVDAAAMEGVDITAATNANASSSSSSD
eukprot:CAMPEP_0168844828 /NCGR_PEP_ID=MMETSP0727-20121128/8951_1 /TAXON_ID=265536 /ORGANISM="Amphiprora sp., Strain CCMP467" /LENGTH=322 /DNA_ID=CAMNT_0008898509 /DNA_START=51 /DNA_END=1017 /DNA_ORIENTATION=+